MANIFIFAVYVKNDTELTTVKKTTHNLLLNEAKNNGYRLSKGIKKLILKNRNYLR